ncbi:MAG: LacI family DNA-binding transcriptional regulator [Flavobacteriales bacterium]|nr:LacI family DNA-binding transcriptional regulator [Flavobacteriales bacterium]
MKNNKATIHDISRSLGIDSSTVSRALNGSDRVKDKTKELINKKAEELGYRKNIMARNLRMNRTFTIGVIVPRIDRHFFAKLIAGIEETAFNLNYEVIIAQSLDSLEREKKLLANMLNNRVDGLLISTTMETISYDHFDAYKDENSPIIFVDRPNKIGYNSNVIINDQETSLNATQHLIDNGYKNIVHFAGPQEVDLYKLRLAGYKAALEKNGIEFNEDYVIESRLMQEDGEKMAKQILELPNVDAVFAANDHAAIGAMKRLKEQGVKIPEDIAFMGFSDEPISEYIEPGLSTVKQPATLMGKEATSLLIGQIENKSGDIVHTKILDAELIVRNSTKKITA